MLVTTPSSLQATVTSPPAIFNFAKIATVIQPVFNSSYPNNFGSAVVHRSAQAGGLLTEVS